MSPAARELWCVTAIWTISSCAWGLISVIWSKGCAKTTTSPIQFPRCRSVRSSRICLSVGLRDEGLFSEYCIPVNDDWKITLGGRADWIDTNALLRDIRPDTNLDVDELVQHDVLYSYYLTNELKVGDAWTLDLGYGYAQRPTTLTERYADGVFLGILQSGFTRVIGTPDLRPERNFQLDAGLSANYDNFRGSLTGFYAWVVDYVTFDGLAVVDFFDAKLVRYRNTPLAILTGFEAAGEWDWSPNLTPFAKLKYVQGTDEFVGPLFAIPPLEGTVGLRWHDLRANAAVGI